MAGQYTLYPVAKRKGEGYVPQILIRNPRGTRGGSATFKGEPMGELYAKGAAIIIAQRVAVRRHDVRIEV